jgi:hypothetical protein
VMYLCRSDLPLDVDCAMVRIGIDAVLLVDKGIDAVNDTILCVEKGIIDAMLKKHQTSRHYAKIGD